MAATPTTAQIRQAARIYSHARNAHLDTGGAPNQTLGQLREYAADLARVQLRRLGIDWQDVATDDQALQLAIKLYPAR